MNLNQVTIASVDLERSLEFYTRLGLVLIVKALPHYLRFEAPEGQSTFSVHLADQVPASSGVSVYFESNELDTLVAKLQAKGIEFYELPQDRSWGWREARLKDPDGNNIILFYGGDNRKNPPWKVTD